MDFPLPIRSVTTVDYSIPLHVDTNQEYTLDMEKFPELNDPSHYWQPALAIDSHSCSPSYLSLTSSEMTSSLLNESHEELFDLIDTYAIHDLQENDLDFGFADLAPSSPYSLLESNDIYLESCFTCELSVHSILSASDMNDSGFESDTDENYAHQNSPEQAFLTCQQTTSGGFNETTRRSNRKRSALVICEETQKPVTLGKRRKLEVSYESVQSLTA